MFKSPKNAFETLNPEPKRRYKLVEIMDPHVNVLALDRKKLQKKISLYPDGWRPPAKLYHPKYTDSVLRTEKHELGSH